VSLERLCEQVVSEHDYDLAVLARWDGNRRYANLRKLMRLARSYEELRGRDIEGFVAFIRQQEALGAAQLEAVSEEEGADAVRLLTIHAAKGLEFKVVVVADAGRDTGGAPTADEILALSDGRFGFRVVHPTTGMRKPVFDYDDVREAEKAADRAERLRLYYVAMTRAVDRLIVSGAIDDRRDTPIGWVLSRLGCEDELAAEHDEPIELERGGATFLVRVDRHGADVTAVEDEPVADEDGQLALFAELPSAPIARGYRLPELAPVPVPPLHRVRSLSFTALSLFELCSYRYYAQRIAGLRERRIAAPGGSVGLAATEIGDAVHRLLEEVDLAAPDVPAVEVVRTWYPTITDEELERVRAFVASYCESELGRRIAGLRDVRPERPFAFEHDGVLLHGRLDALWREGTRALVLDYKTNTLEEGTPDEIVDSSYRLQRLVYALACFRGGAEEVEVVYAFLERPDAVVSTVFERAQVPELEAELSAAIARINAGEFVPTPDEFTCNGCPALDVVCAGPRLRGNGGGAAAPAVVREAVVAG
jgi:ATP-dependent exoDNAse (exonuclease V) beta subunit